MAEAEAVSVGWPSPSPSPGAVPPELTTASTPAARIATTAIALTAITTTLWPVQMRSITCPSLLGLDYVTG